MTVRSSFSIRWLVATTSLLCSFASAGCGGQIKEPVAGDRAATAPGRPSMTMAGAMSLEPPSLQDPVAPDLDKNVNAGRAAPAPAAPAPPAGDAADGSTTGAGTMPKDAQCVQGKQLFFEDFEDRNYDRWSSNTYLISAKEHSCYENEFSTEQVVDGKLSHLTSIGCTAPESHRIYGGVQFNGDQPVGTYTNSGTGIDAPGGLVVSFWNWLDAPDGFGDGRWFSPFTVNNSCDWSATVITLGIEDKSGRLNTVHISDTGGSVDYVANRPVFPLRQWVRVTLYINYHTGQFHVWQDGMPTTHARFTRNSKQICQFHWGLYASGQNDDVTLFEDDIGIWKLDQPLTDYDHEPWPAAAATSCK